MRWRYSGGDNRTQVAIDPAEHTTGEGDTVRGKSILAPMIPLES
jgi:hypothetical protein